MLRLKRNRKEKDFFTNFRQCKTSGIKSLWHFEYSHSP